MRAPVKGGGLMAIEALNSVFSAEEQADLKLAAAAQEVRKILAESEMQGKQMILNAEAEAEETVEAMHHEAELKAAESARTVAARTLTECQALRTAAMSKMQQAVGLVVGRIVND